MPPGRSPHGQQYWILFLFLLLVVIAVVSRNSHHDSWLVVADILLFPPVMALATTRRQRRSSSRPPSATMTAPPTTTSHHFRIGASLRRQQGVLMVDVENVRGTSGFAVSHLELLDQLQEWSTVCGLTGRGQVIMIVDHGADQYAYWTTTGGLGIVFAGPHQTADDVMANDIGRISEWAQDWKHQQQRMVGVVDQNRSVTTKGVSGAPIWVVTGDQGLIGRCQTSTARKHVEIVSSLSLLEELERLTHHHPQMIGVHASNRTTRILDSVQKEITWGIEWLLIQSKIDASRTKHIPNKRRHSMAQKRDSWQRKLEGTEVGRQVLEFVAWKAASNTTDDSNDQNFPLHPDLQVAISTKWDEMQEKLKYRPCKKETTQDRVILAEAFRGELEQSYHDTTSRLYHRKQGDILPILLSPAESYVREYLQRSGCIPGEMSSTKAMDTEEIMNSSGTSTLRMVVISDTHGMERDLGPLPDGDVLLHLGDYSLDGTGKASSIQAFDTWLAQQPHRHKIVLRGNHDPPALGLHRSGATFVTKPQSIVLAGFALTLIPFVSRLTAKCLPTKTGCDVVASHVPPKNVLDRCLTGKAVGSPALRRRLQHMVATASADNTKCPQVVLCGHIHEGRGWIRHDFTSPASQQEHVPQKLTTGEQYGTLVINAANANPGMAQSIAHGPVVVELSRDEQGSPSDISVQLQMEEAETRKSALA